MRLCRINVDFPENPEEIALYPIDRADPLRLALNRRRFSRINIFVYQDPLKRPLIKRRTSRDLGLSSREKLKL